MVQRSLSSLLFYSLTAMALGRSFPVCLSVDLPPLLSPHSGVLLPVQGVPQRFQEDGRVAAAAHPGDTAQALPVHPVQQAEAAKQRAREEGRVDS